jgi:serine/threonine-protein kinase
MVERGSLEATWERHGIDAGSLSIHTDGTVVHAKGTSTRLDPASSLPMLVGNAGRDELELAELLSEGGMGRVHAGTQVSMQRAVAVKRLRPGLGSASTAQLLVEARVTGALEHPAIVPVHALGVDAEGSPLIVMKRVSGDSWAERLAQTRGDPEALDQNLAVLEQIANAVAFAHSRGVMHRDIKPENVLLGTFGEVYLVDWGLALDLGDAGIEGLAHVSAVRGIAGTIPYMAPEQALGVGSELGPHTDVFQLGATLLEVLTGRPPHALPSESNDQSLTQLFYSIFTFEPPELASWVPTELAVIVREALAADVTARTPDAVGFRDALARFRAHRDSMLATERAARRLAQVRDRDADDDGALLAEARFGFEQALRTWGDNEEARRGLDETLVVMAERELLARRPDAAQVLIARLERRRPELDARLAELRAEITTRRRRVEALEAAARESDLSLAARSRRGLGIAFAVAFFAVNAGAAWLERLGVWEVDHLRYLGLTTVVAVLFAAPTVLRRDRLFPNAATWRVVTTVGFMLVGQVAAFAALWAYGVAFRPTLIVTLFPLATAISIVTYLMERRVFWTSFAVLGAAAVAVLWPDVTLEMVGLAYAVYFIRGATLSWDEASPLRVLDDVRRSGWPKEEP